MVSIYPETAKEALEMFKSGESVSVVELGA